MPATRHKLRQANLTVSTAGRSAVVCVVVMAVSLSACGRRSALEPPPGLAATSGHYAATTPDPDYPAAPADKSTRPFFLDFLL